MVQEDPSDTEYQIYSIALATVHQPKNGELIVFSRRTHSTVVSMMEDEDIKEELQGRDPREIIALGFPEISKETVAQFLDKNRTGGVLEARLSMSSDQKSLSDDERATLRGDPPDGWRKFYQRY